MPGMAPRRAAKPGQTEADDKIDKGELFRRILDAALRLDYVKGHLRWKMTDLARASGVTRSLIYYYFGNSKTALMKEAVRTLGEEFFGLSEERQALWREGRLTDSFHRTRELARGMPHIVIFYLSQRKPGSPLHSEISELERRYLEKLRAHFPGAPLSRVRATFALLFGLAAMGDIANEAWEEAVTHAFGLLHERT